MASVDEGTLPVSIDGSESEPPPPTRWANLVPIATAVLIAIGIGLRVWQYLADPSLSHDESDRVRRLLPLLCSIAAIVLFWRVAARTLSAAVVPIAVGLFALAIPLVRYSVSVEPYELDVLATLVLTLIALELRARPVTVGQCVLAGVAGLVIVWFSQAAVLVLVGLAVALAECWLWKRDASSRRTALITVPLWALASLVGLLMSRYHTTPEALASLRTDRIAQFFADGWMPRYPSPILYTTLTILGLALIWRRRDVALILLGPVAVTVVVVAAHAYPLRAGAVLFLLPSVLIALTEAIDVLLILATSVHPRLGVLMATGLLAPPIYAVIVDPPPYTVESFKPAVASVNTGPE